MGSLLTRKKPKEPQAEKVAPMSDELHRALYGRSHSFSYDLELPELSGETQILTEEHRRSLATKLPARAQGYTWQLIFGTDVHGFSLRSLYRKMTDVESPILLIIQDTDDNVFGALTSTNLKVSELFYGTGESFLFTFSPEFRIFKWSKKNTFFVKGNINSLAIGSEDGHFGLWLDEDLHQGRSQSCSTYDNPPLVPDEDFVMKAVECWAFL